MCTQRLFRLLYFRIKSGWELTRTSISNVPLIRVLLTPLAPGQTRVYQINFYWLSYLTYQTLTLKIRAGVPINIPPQKKISTPLKQVRYSQRYTEKTLMFPKGGRGIFRGIFLIGNMSLGRHFRGDISPVTCTGSKLIKVESVNSMNSHLRFIRGPVIVIIRRRLQNTI